MRELVVQLRVKVDTDGPAIVSSSQAMRALVVNSAGASQLVPQNGPDLPRQIVAKSIASVKAALPSSTDS